MLAQAQKITIFAILALPATGCFHDPYDGPSGATEGTTTESEAGSTSSTASGDGDGDGDGDTSTGTAGDGDGDGDSTGGADGAAWGACLGDEGCSAPFPLCLIPEGTQVGFCTNDCDDAQDCAAPGPGVNGVASICHETGACMISCEAACPGAMVCSDGTFDGWPVGGVCLWP